MIYKRIAVLFLFSIAFQANPIVKAEDENAVCVNDSGVVGTTADYESDRTGEISPKCASVLLAAGTGLGATLSYTLTPMALCSAGFCSTGVAAGSFASWWQSTMPLIAKGSVFSTLQSIAMGTGAKMALPGAMIGGPVGLAYLTQLCEFVDETDPDSHLGQMFDTTETVVTKAIEMKEDAKKYCDSSEICTEVSDTVGQATVWASSQWKRIKAAATDSAKDFISSLSETGKLEENEDIKI